MRHLHVLAHLSCTDYPDIAKYSKTAWACPTCRSMPATVAFIQRNFQTVTNLLQQLSASHQEGVSADETTHTEADTSESESGNTGSPDSSPVENSLIHGSEKNDEVETDGDSALLSNQEAWMRRRRE